MATTRAIRISETVSGGLSLSSSSFTQTAGEGVDWNGSRALTLQNTAPISEIISHTFADQSSLLQANGIYPATRNSIKFRGLQLTQSAPVNSGGVGVSFTIPIFTFSSSQGGSSTQTFNNQTGTGHTQGLTDAYITGSDATNYGVGAGVNDLTSMSCRFQLNTSNNNSNGLHSVVNRMVNPTLIATIDKIWEGNDIVINGSDSSHTLPAFASAFTIVEESSLIRDSGPVSTNTAFTITEGSENFKIAPLTAMTSSFTMSVTTAVAFKPTVAVSSAFGLQASTENFVRLDPLTVSSAFTFAVTPILKVGPALVAITSSATLGSTPTLIFDVEGDYTWNQFSNNPFFVSGYVKGGYTNDAEYEWDDLATDTWNDWTYGTWLGDETNWDNWTGDTWNREFLLQSVFSMPNVVPTYKLIGASALTSAFTFTEGAAFVQNPGAQTLSSAFTVGATAQGIIDIPSTNLASAFTLAVSDVDFLDNIEPLTISAAFTLAVTPTHIVDQQITLANAFTFTLATGSVKYDIENTEPSAFTTDFVGNVISDIDITLNALASQLSAGRLIVPADPYNIITVEAETRTLVIPAENRISTIMEENRLNTISNETRLVGIVEETRLHTLKIPGLTNKYSTPRVRSET